MEPVSRTEFNALREELAELKLTYTKRAMRGIKRKKSLAAFFLLLLIAVPATLYAVSITKSHSFAAGTPTVAAEVNTNFDQLFTKVNDLAAYHPPVGSILAWHKSLAGTPPLPGTGEWVECNGQMLNDAQSSYNGQVIPNLNGNASGADSPGQAAKVAMFLRGGITSGIGQLDTFQGHAFYSGIGMTNNSPFVYGQDTSDLPGASTQLVATQAGTADRQARTSMAKTDGTNGTPRTSSETRPVNMAVVWIMKVK